MHYYWLKWDEGNEQCSAFAKGVRHQLSLITSLQCRSVLQLAHTFGLFQEGINLLPLMIGKMATTDRKSIRNMRQYQSRK